MERKTKRTLNLSNLSKTSLLLFICFGIDKCVAVLRQMIIGRQFGLSVELDVFNIANNLPDMLFTLISGGALSMALIPVMSDIINKDGKKAGWKLFSSVANLSFLCAAGLAILTAIFAKPLVVSEIGIAPGFTPEQQSSVIHLMRMNLIAMLIFALSGYVVGGLQANRHFLMPALAPIFYNIGQIFGAVVLSPSEPYRIGPLSLPCFGMGIDGLVWGVIIGAAAHLLIQVPALFRHNFRWFPMIALHDPSVLRVLRVLGPRILSVFFIQLIFIIRDNYASRLASGAVTALSYGYMFQQLPETLIGTAIGTAILPSLSLYISNEDAKSYREVIEKACRIALALSLGAAAIMAVGLGPLIGAFFAFDETQNLLMMRTLQGFLVGLAGHCLLEIANRAFYAQEQALVPLLGTILNVIIYIISGFLLFQKLGAPGLSLTDSIAFTVQAILLLLVLAKPERFLQLLKGKTFLSAVTDLRKTLLRSIPGAAAAGGICFAVMSIPNINNLVKSILGMTAALFFYGFIILPEIKLLRRF
ncbi:MAG: murein biosynthesis integral membrane protein MurJ [Anaerolineaceae bacterium]|nr:murein biosynthesis integral membrane protein MurJ [Anaerolineaceae bacterium]